MTPTEQSYCEIPLSRGQVAIVDTADYDWLMQWKWYALWRTKEKTYSAVRNNIFEDGIKRMVYMHRQILGLDRGDKRQGDHKNHQTLDNRRNNLRIATHAQQQWNTQMKRTNKIGFKGVTFHKQTGRWRARIGLNGKPISLGIFPSPEEAHKAYKEAAERLYGEFSCVS